MVVLLNSNCEYSVKTHKITANTQLNLNEGNFSLAAGAGDDVYEFVGGKMTAVKSDDDITYYIALLTK